LCDLLKIEMGCEREVVGSDSGLVARALFRAVCERANEVSKKQLSELDKLLTVFD
jgi:hypothetical protein